MKSIKRIKFQNKNRPKLNFDLVKLDKLLSKQKTLNLTDPHIIEFFHILIFTSGKGFHSIDFKNYSYQKGTLLTIRKDQMHRFFINPNAKGYMLLFTEEFLSSHFGKDEVLRSFQLFNEMLICPKIDLDKNDYNDIIKSANTIDIEYNAHEDDFSKCIIRSELHVLLVKLFRIKSKSSSKLFKRKYFEEFLIFQKLIERNFSKTKKVLDYSKMMNCTPKTLNNITKNILNKPAKMVINEIVIVQIKRLLLNTSFTINEIAYKAGFSETTNMFRFFKKNTNKSPEAFRKENI